MDGTNQQEQPTKKMKVAELRAELQQRGADVSGKKAELAARLELERRTPGAAARPAAAAAAAPRKRKSTGGKGGKAKRRNKAAAPVRRQPTLAMAQRSVPAAASAGSGLAPAWLRSSAAPPASICHSTGERTHHPGTYFASTAAGRAATALKDDLGMHAGSVTISFSVAEEESVANLMSFLTPSVTAASGKAWRTAGDLSGESPIQAGQLVLVARLYKAVCAERLEADQDWAVDWLQATESLIVTRGGAWQAPLIRVLCAPPAASDSRRFDLTLHVYFKRLLFYLIAYDPTSTMLQRLTPPVPVVEPCHVLPRTPPCFSRTDVTGNERFTLEGLLRSREHTGYAELRPALRTSLDAQLSKTLKRYQSQTVAWMLDQEKLPRGLNSLFWETRHWGGGGGHEFFYAPELGELRLERPPVVRGGLLCDEMGLGKTLEIIAMIIATSAEALEPPPADRDDITTTSRASLIIVPEPLLAQWSDEIAGSTTPSDLLSVIKCTGQKRPRREPREAGGADAEGAEEEEPDGWDPLEFDVAPLTKSAAYRWGLSGEERQQELDKAAEERQAALEALADHDVVLTTYKSLTADGKALAAQFKKVHWKRIVLDEMQEVRSSTTQLALLCERLSASTRWMVSGTPLYDSIDDLNGELNFLKIWPFALRDKEDGFWANSIGGPWERKDPVVLKRLDLLLSGVMMRHSKKQTNLHDGRSILVLPPLRSKLVPITPTDSEKALIAFLEVMSVQLLENSNLIEEAAVQEDEAEEQEDGSDEDGAAAPARAAPRRRRRRGGGGGAGGHVSVRQLLKLQREACTAAALIAGGSGCKHALETLHKLKTRLQAIGQTGASGGGTDTVTTVGSDDALRHLPINKAYEDLMQSQQREQLQQNTDFEFHGQHQAMNHYNTGGWRQAVTAVERRDEATEREAELEHQIAGERRFACIKRWRWAVEQVSSGRGLSLPLVLSPAGATARPRRFNPVSAYFEALPLRLLRKRFKHVKLHSEMEAVTAELTAAQAAAKEDEMDNETLAEELDLTERQAAKMTDDDGSTNKGWRSHYENLLVKPQRDARNALKTDHAKQYPIGWRRPELPQVKLSAKMEQVQADRAAFESEFKASVAAQLGVDAAAILITAISGEGSGRGQRVSVVLANVIGSTQFGAHAAAAEVSTALDGTTLAGYAVDEARTQRSEGKGVDMFKKNAIEAQQAWQSAENAKKDLEKLQPWVEVCKVAADQEIASGGASAQILKEQQGFQSMQKLMEVSGVVNCPVCMDPLQTSGSAKQPVVTKCIHIFCDSCLQAHLHAHKVMMKQSQEQSGQRRTKEQEEEDKAKATECPCPICRRLVRRHELVVLEPRTDGDNRAPASNGEDGPSSAEDGEAAAAAAGADPRAAAAAPGSDGSDRIPTLTLAPSEFSAFEEIPLPEGEIQKLLGPYPAVPARLLTHLAAAAGVTPGCSRGTTPEPSGRSSKMLRLLEDLERAVHGSQAGKAVVFSQSTEVIKHAAAMLGAAGLPYVSICPGDSQKKLRDAVADFNNQKSRRVFLLHAGTAAAGLTLTAARYVFLLEPFLFAAEEAQAMNRAHRIGQQQAVSVTTYYVPDSIEERLLAFRRLSGEADADAAEASGEGMGMGVGAGADGGQGMSAAKYKAIFGLSTAATPSPAPEDSEEEDEDYTYERSARGSAPQPMAGGGACGRDDMSEDESDVELDGPEGGGGACGRDEGLPGRGWK